MMADYRHGQFNDRPTIAARAKKSPNPTTDAAAMHADQIACRAPSTRPKVPKPTHTIPRIHAAARSLELRLPRRITSNAAYEMALETPGGGLDGRRSD